MKQKDFRLNIQLFADEGGNNPPAPTGTEGQEGTPAGAEGTTVEVPEYISSYVSGIEDEEQKEYLQGLIKDEKGLGILKNFIKDPGKEWDIKADEYKDLPDDVSKFLEEAKQNGFTEEQAKIALEKRKEYITREREAMTPELRQYDATIANFITAEKDEQTQGVYARLAENAAGRKVLIELMQLKSGGPTPSAGASSSAQTGKFNLDDWKKRYDAAILSQDQDAKKALKAEAMSSGGEYKEYFNIFFREN